VLKNVFEQCYKMDKLGLNKEEMHHPVKHIVVQKNGKPVLLDFERCKSRKRQHNVTQFCQFVISVAALAMLTIPVLAAAGRYHLAKCARFGIGAGDDCCGQG